MSIALPTASALLQAGLRQRIIDVKQALALRQGLVACGEDQPAIAAMLTAQPTSLPPERATALAALLAPEPRMVGDCRLLARLGSGHLGTTWLALGPNGLVVVKRFHTELFPGTEESARLLRDLGSLTGGGHRYLVAYHSGVTTEDGSIALIQEYRQGRDSAQRALAKGSASEVRALTILRQSAKGLAVLQHAGRCHGDLHPGNILLDGDGRAALGDHSLCGLADGGLRSRWHARRLARHSWAAPEEFAEQPKPSIAADIYALGCIGFWLMAGVTPFPGSALKQEQQHLGAARPDVRVKASQVSEMTAKTLLKMMQQDPAARYTDARALVHSLERDLDALDDTPGSAPVVRPSALEPRASRDLRDDSDDGTAASSLILMEPQ